MLICIESQNTYEHIHTFYMPTTGHHCFFLPVWHLPRLGFRPGKQCLYAVRRRCRCGVGIQSQTWQEWTAEPKEQK